MREVGLNSTIIEKQNKIDEDMQIKAEMSEKMYNLYLELHQAKQEIKNLKRKKERNLNKIVLEFF